MNSFLREIQSKNINHPSRAPTNKCSLKFGENNFEARVPVFSTLATNKQLS